MLDFAFIRLCAVLGLSLVGAGIIPSPEFLSFESLVMGCGGVYRGLSYLGSDTICRITKRAEAGGGEGHQHGRTRAFPPH